MKIAIWGDELAAWVSAVSLAEKGNHIYMVRETHNTALIPKDTSICNEPGLMAAIQTQRDKKQLFACSFEEGCAFETHWMAMAPSEFNQAQTIIDTLTTRNKRLLVINQSNFGIGASEKLRSFLIDPAHQSIAYIPDTLQQGLALYQFNNPDVLIIGSDTDRTLPLLKAIFRPFSGGLEQIQFMSPQEAEFTKFAINGMLALRLGYINELANLADQLQVDIDLVIQGMSADVRVGKHYLQPGCGFGGQHFTHSIKSLADLLSHKQRSTLLEMVLSENEKQKELPFRKLWQHYQCDIRDKVISIWGVAFKPGIASIENAPAVRVIKALLAQGAVIKVHDPAAMLELHTYFGANSQIIYCETAIEATLNSDALLLITEWNEYASPDFDQLKANMKTPLIIDGRNIWEPQYLRELGFTYYGVGR